MMMNIAVPCRVIVALMSCTLSIGLRAADPPALPAPSPLTLSIPVNLANRAAGAVECSVKALPTCAAAALAFSPDGKTLAVGGYQEVLLWDITSGKLARRLPVDGFIGSLAYLPDGITLVIGSGKPATAGFVSLFELSGGKELVRFNEPRDVVTCLSVSPDGKLLAGAAMSPAVYVWSIEQKKLARTLTGHSGRVLGVNFSPTGKYLATSGEDSAAILWNVADWTQANKFTEAYAVHGAAFLADEVTVLLAIGDADGSGLRFRKTDSPGFRRPVGGGTAIPLGMVGPSKAGRVYIPWTDKSVRVIDIKNGGVVMTLLGHRDWVQSVALSPDEKLIAAGGVDGSVKLWSNADGRLLATFMQLSPHTDEWLVLTAQGPLATSSPAALNWKGDNLATPCAQVHDATAKPGTGRQNIGR